MKYLIIAIFSLCSSLSANCQDITGLWKGTIFNESDGKSFQYEVLISKEKGKYTGYSHTWFNQDGKKYFGIKKVKIRTAKDGKIIIQDAELIEDNYNAESSKKIIQLDILDFATNNDETTLDGPFVTNATRTYASLTGRVSLKKVTYSKEYSLVQYLDKNSLEYDMSFSK